MAWTLPFAEHRCLFVFCFSTHQVTRVVMLFQPFAGKITPLSLVLVLTQLFQRGHGSLPLVLTTWPFGNATAAGKEDSTVPLSLVSLDPLSRSGHMTSLAASYTNQFQDSCRLSTDWQGTHIVVWANPNPLFLQPVNSNPFHSNMCVCRLKWPSFRCMRRAWEAPSSVL